MRVFNYGWIRTPGLLARLILPVIMSLVLIAGGCGGAPSTPTPTTSPTPTASPTAKPTPTPTTPAVTYTLNVTIEPKGSGSVNLSGSGTYASGEQVTLVATPSAGYEFSSWSGGASGNSPTVTVTVNENKNVVANFTKVRFSLSAGPAVPNTGQVNPATGSFEFGSTINLTAVPASGYMFDHWEGDLTGKNNPLGLLMDANKKVTAVFKEDFQIIEFDMPAGSTSAVWAYFTRELKAGDTIEGYVEISGEVGSTDSFSTWEVRIFGPSQVNVGTWTGNVASTPRRDLGYTTPYTGRHSIGITHVSRVPKKITIKIRPVGWTSAYTP